MYFNQTVLNSKYCVIWIDWKWQNYINFIDIILNEIKDNSKLNRFNRLTFYQMTLTLAGRLTLLLLSICPPGAFKMVQVGNMLFPLCFKNIVFLIFIYSSCLGQSHIVGEFHIRQRIILISDGRPTDFTSTSHTNDDDAAAAATAGFDEVNPKF